MIRSAMSDIPEDRWEAAFGKLVDSSNGKTSVSKTEVPSSSLGQSADGGWIDEQIDNQENNGKG